MNDLTVPSGETHTVPEQETETYSQVNVGGGLNVGGELNIGGEPEVPSHKLDYFPPERMARIVQTTVNQVAGAIHRSETFSEIPPLFKKPANAIESNISDKQHR